MSSRFSSTPRRRWNPHHVSKNLYSYDVATLEARVQAAEAHLRACEARDKLAEYIARGRRDRERFGQALKRQDVAPFDNIPESVWTAAGCRAFTPRSDRRPAG